MASSLVAKVIPSSVVASVPFLPVPTDTPVAVTLTSVPASPAVQTNPLLLVNLSSADRLLKAPSVATVIPPVALSTLISPRSPKSTVVFTAAALNVKPPPANLMVPAGFVPPVNLTVPSSTVNPSFTSENCLDVPSVVKPAPETVTPLIVNFAFIAAVTVNA